MTMTIDPPDFSPQNFELYKQELRAWSEVTEISRSKQVIVIALSIKDTATREKVLNQLSLEDLKEENGLEILIKFLDSFFGKDEISDALEKYEDFENFQRADNQSVTNSRAKPQKPRQCKSMLIHQGWFTALYTQHLLNSQSLEFEICIFPREAIPLHYFPLREDSPRVLVWGLHGLDNPGLAVVIIQPLPPNVTCSRAKPQKPRQWKSMLFHRRGLLWLGSAVRYIWWQRWDNDNCRNGVALPM